MVSRASYLCLMLKGEQNTNYDWWDGIAQWLHSRFQTSFPGFEPDCWKNEFPKNTNQESFSRFTGLWFILR